MTKPVRYFALGLTCLMALIVPFIGCKHGPEAESRGEHFRQVDFFLNAIVSGFNYNPINRHWSIKDETKFGNSWRLYYSLTYPFDDADAERGDGNQPWQSESLQSWDDKVHNLFCAQKISELRRDQRYANLMAISGAGW